MDKTLTVEIAEGLGNQLFMYSYAYSLHKKFKYKIQIDNTSGYYKIKNRLRDHQNYMLHLFNIDQNMASSNLRYDNILTRSKKKIQLFFDNFNEQKRFLIEKKIKINGTKIAQSYRDFDYSKLSNSIYVQGNFEDYNYFNIFRNDLISMYKPLKKYIKNNNKIIDKLINSNSVSIALRRNRYSEPFSDNKSLAKIKKSNDFDLEQSKYVLNAIEYFNKKINNPIFFVFSDDFTDIYKLIPKNKNIFLVNEFKNNKIVEDFYLMGKCKHFIVGPTTFHWWAAWLSRNNNKICLRPKLPFLNPSGNSDFWPSSWIAI